MVSHGSVLETLSHVHRAMSVALLGSSPPCGRSLHAAEPALLRRFQPRIHSDASGRSPLSLSKRAFREILADVWLTLAHRYKPDFAYYY